ncbi:hypothetical protein BDV93DRAFT_514891 [Ceratobasidium sp. AG-I]|nr:hypothetical protein BDV93DRAFT_514891 [Ceratobasidium sp. AG-I]
MFDTNDMFSKPANLTCTFPLELMGLLFACLPFDDLRSLAGISQIFWQAACPILWRRVYRLEFLLRAAIGESFEEFRLQDEDEENSRPLTSGQLGATFGPQRAHSFNRVTAYVQVLHIYDIGGLQPLYLSRNLVEALVAAEAKRALLPRLRWVSIGVVDWDDPLKIIYRWSSSAYDLNLLGLFLSPTVERLAIMCKPGTLHMDKLGSRAPSLQQLHLLLDKYEEDDGGEGIDDGESDDEGGQTVQASLGSFPTEPDDDDEIWMRWAMQYLSSWENLASLSFSSMFLTPRNAVFLGRILSLRRLTIQCDPSRASDLDDGSPSGWDGIRFEPGSFPQLEYLAVPGIALGDALALFGQPEIMGGLTQLKVTLGSSAGGASSRVGDLLARLSARAPGLRKLKFHSRDPTVAELWPLSTLPLTSIDFTHLWVVGDTAPLLLSLNPELELLYANWVTVPATSLADIAARYRKLRILGLGLTLGDPASLDGQEPGMIDGQVRLYVHLRYTDHMTQAEKQLAKESLVRYLGRLWTDATLTFEQG